MSCHPYNKYPPTKIHSSLLLSHVWSYNILRSSVPHKWQGAPFSNRTGEMCETHSQTWPTRYAVSDTCQTSYLWSIGGGKDLPVWIMWLADSIQFGASHIRWPREVARKKTGTMHLLLKLPWFVRDTKMCYPLERKHSSLILPFLLLQ